MWGKVVFLEGVGFEVVDFEGFHAAFLALAGFFRFAVGFPFSFADGLGKNGLFFTFAKLEVKVVVGFLFCPGIAKGGKEGDAVVLFGSGEFEEFAHCRKDIPEGADVCGAAAGGDDAGPAGKHGSADSAFVHVALHTTE